MSFFAHIYKIDGNSFVKLFLPSAWHIAVGFYRIISKQCTTHEYVVYWDFGYERKTMILSLNVKTILSVRYLEMITVHVEICLFII